jgi:dynein light intermediate chain 1
LVKRQPLKHNVIDRDKVVVPPNWDSWGKIRVLREGFNVEGVSQAWSLDIDDSVDWGNPQMNGLSTPKEENSLAEPQMVSAVAYYEETVKDPRADSPTNPSKELDSVRLEVEHQDPQTFLATQLEILDRIKSTADSNTVDKKREGTSKVLHQSEAQTGDVGNAIVESRVNEHIGPVQFNMGGIQVDADDMLKRLKVFILL